MIDVSFFEQRAATFAFLGEQEVGLCGSRKVGHAVAGIQKDWTLGIRQCGVRLNFEGFVVTKVAREAVSKSTGKRTHIWASSCKLTCHRGT